MARMVICSVCGEKKQHKAKGLCLQCYNKAHNKAYYKARKQTLEYKTYRQTPEFKAYIQAYDKARHQTPEYKVRIKAYRQRPEYKAYMKAYNKARKQTPEFKVYKKAYQQRPEYKAYMKAYHQAPDKYCIVCNCDNNLIDNYNILNKHRIIPGKQGGKYTKDNVASLCPTCHTIIHRLIFLNPDNPNYYTRDGVIASIKAVLNRHIKSEVIGD